MSVTNFAKSQQKVVERGSTIGRRETRLYSEREKHTECLVRVGSGRINGIRHGGIVVLDRHRSSLLADTARVVIVFGIAGWDVATNFIVLHLVLIIGGGHGDCWSWSEDYYL